MFAMGALIAGQMLEGTSYQIVREIGAGGMGVVYEIEHVRLKKRYVAKVIHEQIKHDDGALKRMEREAQVLAGITHTNVVQVHDFGTTNDGVTYFVMERLNGVDLRRYMKRFAISRLRAIGIMVDVLDALEHVHRQGIVHRDIKPENIFLAEQSTQLGAAGPTVTKVLDFGIVSIVDGDGRISQGRITKTGGFVGTLYYAAPEQMQGKPPGPANDIYAAGLVLFELIAGRGPFDDDPGVGLSRCFKEAPSLSEVSRAPRELSDVVAQALAQDPARRPSAGAFATALRSVSTHPNVMQGGDEPDSVRAEVDQLLAQFEPMHPAPIMRPAAGRQVTPPSASAAVAAFGVAGTAAPQTPLMPGAPGRVYAEPQHPNQASISLDPTIASPSPPLRPSHQPTYLSQPPHAAAAVSAPGTAHGLGPYVPHAQAIASTSPGVYATVDGIPHSSASALPRSSPLALIAAVGGAIVLVALLITGAFLWKHSFLRRFNAIERHHFIRNAFGDNVGGSCSCERRASAPGSSIVRRSRRDHLSVGRETDRLTPVKAAVNTRPGTITPAAAPPHPATVPSPASSTNIEKDGYVKNL